MRKHRTLMLAAAVTALIAAATGATVASASTAPSHPAAGTEYIQVMSASTAPVPASVIARGVFAAAGHVRLGDARISTITFPGGTIVVSHHAGHGTSQFYPPGCLSVISQSGSYHIVRGTGRYAGISATAGTSSAWRSSPPGCTATARWPSRRWLSRNSSGCPARSTGNAIRIGHIIPTGPAPESPSIHLLPARGWCPNPTPALAT